MVHYIILIFLNKNKIKIKYYYNIIYKILKVNYDIYF